MLDRLLTHCLPARFRAQKAIRQAFELTPHPTGCPSSLSNPRRPRAPCVKTRFYPYVAPSEALPISSAQQPCSRYRPAARQPQEVDLGAGHLGFRTVLNRSGSETPRARMHEKLSAPSPLASECLGPRWSTPVDCHSSIVAGAHAYSRRHGWTARKILSKTLVEWASRQVELWMSTRTIISAA
jgi:hypothetical protein